MFKKKLLIMLLIVVLVGGGVVAAFAISGSLGDDKDDKGPSSIYDIINNSTATAITTSMAYETADRSDSFSGWYEIKRDGNDMIVDYTYDRYRTVEEGVTTGDTDRFVEEKGVIYYLDGKYYNGEDENKTPWVDLPLDASFKFKIEKEKLTAIKSSDANSFTAKMTKEACLEMFGLDLSAEGDINLSVVTNGIQLTELGISYVTDSGASVSILTTYSYNDLTLDFTPITGEVEQ